MKCLHGKPASCSTTQNGSFWFCGQKQSCNFFCPEDQGYLFEKAIDSWRSLGTQQPHCDGHHKLATMRVVKDVMKASYGRPFFVCSERSNPCKFWMWGDTNTVKKPNCRHGFPCCIRIVKKEGVNKDREFFIAQKERKIRVVSLSGSQAKRWIPIVNFTPQYSYDIPAYFDEKKSKNDFINRFQSMNIA